MKRIAKILLILTVIVAALLFAGVWFLNRWIKSPATHAMVERELSLALKLPLKFKSLTLSLFGGLKAEEVTVPDERGNFFEAPSFSATHRLRSLFAGKFVFERITVNSPKFVLHQKPDGKWAAPGLPPELLPKRDTEQKANDKPKTPKPADAPKAKRESNVLIEKIAVLGAAVEMIDKDGKPFASAQGVKITLADVTEDKLEGRVSASRVVLHGYCAITDFSAGISNSREKGLIIPDFIAKIGNGKASGGYSRRDEKPKSKFSGKLVLENVDITRAALDGGAPPPNLMGTLSATVAIRGTNDDTKELSGDVKVNLKDATCSEIEMVRDIGQALKLDEAAEFRIPTASAVIKIWNGRLTVNTVDISAPPLTLRATGTARLDGKMELAARLITSSEFLEKQQALSPQFGPPDESGQRALTFSVNGAFTKPKTNLKERITGTKSKNTQTAILLESALDAAFPKPGAAKVEKPAEPPPAPNEEEQR